MELTVAKLKECPILSFMEVLSLMQAQKPRVGLDHLEHPAFVEA